MSGLGLVAYDSSDNESGDDEGNVVQPTPVPALQPQLEPQPQCSTTSGSMFAIPQTSSTKYGGVHDLFKVKEPPKQTALVKIAIPALVQFDSDGDDSDGEPKEKKQLKDQRAGLFAMLPPPKAIATTSKSFIPNVLTRRTTRPKAVPKKRVPEKTKVLVPDDSDDDGTEKFDVEIWKKVCGRTPKAPRPPIKVGNSSGAGPSTSGAGCSGASTSTSNPGTARVETIVNAAPESTKPYDGLDNQAFKQLVGTSKMHKENIRLVDVNEDQVMPNRDVWMAKALTDPECKPKYVVEDPVNETCKKKHHITYLAQQAKANEQDLQNQWAASRYSRKQTQAKYGF